MIAAADYNLLLQHINEHFGTSRSDLSGHIFFLSTCRVLILSTSISELPAGAEEEEDDDPGGGGGTLPSPLFKISCLLGEGGISQKLRRNFI
jgi:hypothetical protein